MGCHTSKASSVCIEPVPMAPQRVTILVAGGPGTGKSSLCRRFIHKTFSQDDQGAPFTCGTREVTVDGAVVTITVVDVGTASPEEIQSADGVLLTVRADAKQPFAGLYKHTDALDLPGNAARSLLSPSPSTGTGTKKAGASGKIQPLQLPAHSGFTCSDSVPSPLSSTRSSQTGVGQSFKASDEAATTPSFVVGFDTAPELPVVGRLDTGRVSTTSSIRERVPTVYRTLALNTAPVEGKDPFNKSKTRRRKRSFHADIPVAVAVTACDVVDSEEHKAAHPGHVAMLRSTAANWSNARRCRVTFLSAKSGIGVSGAMSHLIQEVVVHKRRAAKAAQR